MAGLVAGLATFLSPCVLPMVPVVLASGTAGGRRRPIGIAIGLAVTFVLATLLASRVLNALGLPQDLVRNLGIALLALVGVMLLVPPLAELVGRPFRPLQATGRRAAQGRRRVRRRPRDRRRARRRLGACAGPILTAVTVLAARNRVGVDAVVLSVSYAIGAALPLLGVAMLGQRATEHGRPARARAGDPAGDGRRARARGRAVHDQHPRNLAAAAPGYTECCRRWSGRTRSSNRLRDLETPGGARPPRTRPAPARSAGRRTRCRTTARRPSSPASHVARHDGGKPLTLAGLRGRVVLIDFWTYSCINCLRTLPQVTAWDTKYRAAGLTIVGVHSPEFAFEHVVSNIQRAIARPGHPLPGRGRQRPRDLVGLGQPVLAGGVPDRPGRPRPVRLVRRGRLRQDRDRDPRPAGRAAGGDRPEPGDRAEQRGHHARDLPRVGAGQSYAQELVGATPQDYTLPRSCT